MRHIGIKCCACCATAVNWLESEYSNRGPWPIQRFGVLDIACRHGRVIFPPPTECCDYATRRVWFARIPIPVVIVGMGPTLLVSIRELKTGYIWST